MFAVVKTGGKQYRVQAGSVICVELLKGKEGQVEFEEVLFVGDGSEMKVGTPHVSGYRVLGEIESEVMGPKVTSYKFNRRKNYHRNKGHRQRYSRVKITEIQAIA